MTNCFFMMASIAIGTILGTLIQDKDLTIPTIISVSIGMIVGYITGRPVSLMASLDGLTAGMMGGMLGVMLQPKSIELMIYFIDIVFVLVILLLIRIIDEEAKTNKQETFNKKPLVANPIVLIVLLVFMGVLVFAKGSLFTNASDQTSKEVEDIKFTSTSNEILEVVVTPTSYTDNILIKAGTPSIINFKTEEVGCTGIILSEELGFNVSLKANSNNYVQVKSLKPRTYQNTCGMNMYKGTITVVI